LIIYRLVHPLSPRGKLVHWGREGLQATNELIEKACRSSQNKQNIVLRHELFRIATDSKQADQMQQTAKEIPDLCDWLEPSQLPVQQGIMGIYGGLRLHNGCKVVHLPSYLQGLWAACRDYQSQNPNCMVRWNIQDVFQSKTKSSSVFDEYDTVVFSAGSGLFGGPRTGWFSAQQQTGSPKGLPVQMVRGQSMLIRLASTSTEGDGTPVRNEALLGGKYISPLPDASLVLVGATHEFQAEPLTQEQVKKELRERTQSFSPLIWGTEAKAERFTSGIRVQSQRGSRGRLPLIGKIDGDAIPEGLTHENAWLFTGLSSRGLLYHAVYGKFLAQAILEGSEECLRSECFQFDWWRLSKQEAGG
jgi:glycine/D-amino acid oxidase-like deaminating enzyme